MGTHDTRIGAALAAATCGLLGVTAPRASLAQDSGKKWDIDSAALYYGESDGRVKDASLALDARRDFGEDRSLDVALHFDTLTGASPNGAIASNTAQTFTSPSGRGAYSAAAGQLPLDSSFHDTRVAVDAGWTQPLGRLFKLDAGVSLSNEFDYQHIGASLGLRRDFDRRNTTLSAAVAFAQDTVKPVGGAPIAFSAMQDAVRGEGEGDEFEGGRRGEDKTVVDLLVGVTQVLGRHSLLRLNYSLSDSSGYLTDPYKILSVVDPVSGDLVTRTPAPGTEGPGGVYLFESRPDSRRRQGLYAEYRQDFGGRVLQLGYRYSTDDWQVDSHTLDARLRVPVGAASYLEPHLRYYTQTAASFYRYSLTQGEPLPQFATADARLGEMSAGTVGLKFGHQTAGGNEWSARLEFYRQSSKVPTGQLIGNQIGNVQLPDFDAVILQFGYRFKL